MTQGERNMVKAGYRWDVIAYFPCNAGGVRVAVRETRRHAERYVRWFEARNHVGTSLRLRHDPLLDEVMNPRRR